MSALEGGWSVNLNDRVGHDDDEIPIRDASGGVVCAVWQMGEDFDGENDDANMRANASRIVACVNACAGISNEALSLGGPFAAARAAITERGALLAALNEIVANDPFNQSSAGIIARKAIAAVQP